MIGCVGSSKSSLLQALLRELPLTGGNIDLNGTIGYASQESCTFTDTIRENILFGCEFNSLKYRKVCHICALDTDIGNMPNRDQTMIGGNGDSLSGGQKARINLAR